jgi:ATP-dependent helicase/nuclease subunit A
MSELGARDAAARHAALDATRSFIVQAPAGSGKTGLLIQRFLVLLAGVAQPESIVAMTFTRKAAGEILERLVDALRSARDLPEPGEPHEALTWRLARKALERDAQQGWQLLAHPARLRILTIDALCGALMRQAPLSVNMGAMPRYVERAEAMYARAAQEELVAASALDSAWRTLLDYQDNDAERISGLVATMLAKRDQWLPHLVARDTAGLRAALEQSLVTEIDRELAVLAATFPRERIDALLEHARYASAHLTAGGTAHPLAAWLTARSLPPPSAAALAQWQALGDWLLTQRGGFRATLTAADGFPAKGRAGDPGSEQRAARKQSMASLLRDLDEVPGLAATLDRARRLPPPSFDEGTWAVIEALTRVLPRAAARLRTVFAREGAIDFAEATMVALSALGGDAPSDLLLAMDTRIAHLLVDEFQDTSGAQCQLVEALTTGWEQDDGRTLFLVGDPMQSIYGFRQADVGQFVRAQHDRHLGSVLLEPLTLSRNFRSRPALVEWVNRVFVQVMPLRDDTLRSEVAFKAAVPTRSAGPLPGVTLDLFADMRREARAVVRHIDAALRDGMKSVAVLVRKRLDLEEILPALRVAGIEFKAVGLDRLSERPALLDLTSLTHALLQPSDHLAWLSTLRAPWCALTLPDLFALAHCGRPIADLVTDPGAIDAMAGLSPDGRARLARFSQAIAPALGDRGRVPLATLVRGTWLALGGPACIAEALDLAAADRFFGLLAEHARGADVPEWHAFTDALASLHVEPDASATARVQLMTLHRAKGLEFDVVVMPGLARPPRGREGQLLLWRERPAGLLLAPLQARTPDAGNDRLYGYLSDVAAEAGAAELGRLLYVGCTRARERLHLTAQLTLDASAAGAPCWKRPVKGTSLAAMWSGVAGEAPSPTPEDATATAAPVATGIPLQRLPLAWRLPIPPAAIATGPIEDVSGERETIAFDWAREAARQIGMAAHRVLRQIADEGLAQWNAARIAGLRSRLERDFGALGFIAEEAQSAAMQVIDAVAKTLDDPRGRWLFDPGQADARSEYALTGDLGGTLVRVVLDRTFIDGDGTRWIVDFKLSRHEGGDREAFLDREQERYRRQLDDYARIMRGLEARPVRVGLYFPLLSGWREWRAPG